MRFGRRRPRRRRERSRRQRIFPPVPKNPGSPPRPPGESLAIRLGDAEAHPNDLARPARLVLWGELQAQDLIDEDYRRLREHGTEVLFVVGREDPYVSLTAVERAANELEARGLTVRTVSFAGGHDIDGPTLMRVAHGDNAGCGCHGNERQVQHRGHYSAHTQP